MINEVFSSCECIEIVSYPKQIYTQNKGSVEIKLSLLKAGEFVYEVIVETNNEIEPEYLFQIEVNVMPSEKISPKPKSINNIIPNLIPRILRERNTELYINVDSVIDEIKCGKEINIIDVRSKENFNNVWIPGSLNIALSYIKTKQFLKNCSLYLINEGYNNSVLEEHCADLRDEGFNTWIIEGGLSYWIKRGGQIEGNLFHQKEIRKLSLQDFFTEKNYDDVIILNISEKISLYANALLAYSQHIPYSKLLSENNNILNNCINKSGTKKVSTILVLNENGKNYDEIEQGVFKDININTFYVDGGIIGYKKFLEKQSKIISSTGNQKTINSQRAIKHCKNCP